MDRISWDDYFMIMACWIARRSPDKSTQHGCVITDKDHRVISQGYNGYPRGSNDSIMPQDRPLKYYCVLHSEENAILFAQQSLEGATAYITGPPCSNCWARIIQSGIKRVVIGNKQSRMIDEKMEKAIELLLRGRDIELVKWHPNHDRVTQNIYKVLDEIQTQEI